MWTWRRPDFVLHCCAPVRSTNLREGEMGFQHNKNRRKRVPRWIRRRNYKDFLGATYWRRKLADGEPRRNDYTSIAKWLGVRG